MQRTDMQSQATYRMCWIERFVQRHKNASSVSCRGTKPQEHPLPLQPKAAKQCVNLRTSFHGHAVQHCCGHKSLHRNCRILNGGVGMFESRACCFVIARSHVYLNFWCVAFGTWQPSCKEHLSCKRQRRDSAHLYSSAAAPLTPVESSTPRHWPPRGCSQHGKNLTTSC